MVELKQFILETDGNGVPYILADIDETTAYQLYGICGVRNGSVHLDEMLSKLDRVSSLFRLCTGSWIKPPNGSDLDFFGANQIFTEKLLSNSSAITNPKKISIGNKLYNGNDLNNYISFANNDYGDCYVNNQLADRGHWQNHYHALNNYTSSVGSMNFATCGITLRIIHDGNVKDYARLSLCYGKYDYPDFEGWYFDNEGLTSVSPYPINDDWIITELGIIFGDYDGDDYTGYDDPNDPYLYDSADDDGGQGTNQNWTPDNITERNMPNNFYGNSGLMKVLTPTVAELNAFSNYLWGNTFDINSFKKIVNNPFDLILGFQYLPFKVTIGGQMAINVGNIASVDTGLHMSYPTQENYKHSFGTLNLSKMEEKFLDYAPYCKMSIHLPFIGTQQIDADLIRKASPVELVYKYNIVTGTICAYLKGTIEGQNGILYEWVGNCNNALPVASNDYTNSISGMVSMVSSAVSGAVTGGAIGGGLGASVGAVTGAVGSLNVGDMKPTITTQGSLGGCGAMLNSSNDAFIITEQQRLSVATNPKGHKHLMGYPKNKGGQIKDSLGYNNIKACRMACDYAMSEELQEITDILTTGYIYGDVGGHPNSKPSRPSGDSLAVALYQNKSSNIRIDKDLTHLHTYDCILKESTSIINPTIRLKATNVNVLKGNYCYIPKFNRFYYINNVTSINADTWELSLHVDVLMSFRDDIETRHVVFNHSESGYNLYLNDGSLQMDSRPKITWNKFPNSIDDSGTYVMLLAGA